MDQGPTNLAKKRTLGYIHAKELAYKLKSKDDFLIYLDKHRKSIMNCNLILFTV